MSIVAIQALTQYGQQGSVNIHHLFEKDESNTVYAHSMDEAIVWVKRANVDAEQEDWGDARVIFTGEWNETDMYSSILYGYEDVTHIRTQYILHPVNTINVSVGYQY